MPEFSAGENMNLNLSSIFRIIGIVMMVICIAMLPSFFVSIIYGESDVAKAFINIILIAGFIGFLLSKVCQYNTKQLRVRDGFLIVTLCWLISTIMGAFPFVVTGSIPSFTDAFFESASGFSTTGGSILNDIEALPRGILFWRSFTHWIGGMGILIFAIALMPSLGISGQNLAVSEAPGPSLDKVTPKMTDTAKILYVTYIMFTIVETILLMLGGMSLYDALIHTFGTVGTGGFSSYNDSIAHFNSPYIYIVITVFMILCGTNFNLFFFSLRQSIKAFLEDSEFKFYILTIVACSLCIFIILMFKGHYSSGSDAALDSSFQVVSILTTTGYATADYEQWPAVAQMIILILMFMGGSSSSTAGGIKIVRILIILKLIRRGISTRLHPNVIETIKLNGKQMPVDTVSAIANHFFLYLALVFFGAFIISFENTDMMTCFTSVITCLGNIGPGFGAVGPSENFSALSDLSKWLLSLYMIAGRLEFYTMFVLLMPKFWSSNR